MNTAEKIYRLRKDAGISQEKLAEMLNISRQTISKWESGTSKPDAEALITLSQLFNVSIDALLKDDVGITLATEDAADLQKPSPLKEDTQMQQPHDPEAEPMPKKANKKTIFTVAMLVIVLLISIGAVLKNASHEAALNKGTNESLNDNQSTGTDISEKAKSVLLLEVYDDAGQLTATGSGFIIDDGKTLATNYHVIEDAYSVRAISTDGGKSDISILLAYDDVADLALLKFENPTELSSLTLADSDHAAQGDNVYAIGYPLGVANTMSEGIISSRYIDEAGTDILQTTAAISSGSSGGALLDENGEVIGIISASYIDGQNMNLAISSNELKVFLSSKSQITTLSERYQQKPHTYSLEYILENRRSLDGETVVVAAYISSAVVLNIDGDFWIDYIIVSDSSDVLGYVGYGYSEDFFEDPDYTKYWKEYEDSRVENYEALGFELTDTDVAYKPGERILVSGTVDDVVYVDEEHGINWHHVLLRDPQIIG